jgi:hypothetical protein
VGILVGVKRPNYEVVEVEQGDFFVRCFIVNRVDACKWNMVTIYGAA